MSKSFRINCIFPDYKLTTVNVHEGNTIENIMNLFKDQFVFIFNGIELQPSMTLRFYDAYAGSPFIAVPKGDKEKRNRWLKMGETERNIIVKLTGTGAIVKEKEYSRLNDIKFSRLELKGKKYIKEMSRILHNMNSDRQLPITTTPTMYTRPATPKKDPLPKFW